MLIADEGWHQHIADGAAICETALNIVLTDQYKPADGLQSQQTEVSFVFTSDSAIAVLNTDYRGKQKPTNVLSFPMVQIALGDPVPPMLGDVVMARETMEMEAQQAGISVHDHTMHLLIHGILHLLGHDHETDEEAELMENQERALLASLGIADPYGSA